MNDRIKRLAGLLPEGTDGVIVTSDVNRFYFTGLDTGDAGTLLITRSGAWFIIDFRYIEVAKKYVTSAKVVLQDKLREQLAALVKESGAKVLAVETSFLTVGGYNAFTEYLPGVRLLNDSAVDKAIQKLRRSKDAQELAAIKAAQAYAEHGFEHICGFIKPGLTEKEVSLELEFYMRKLGADGLSFPTIAVCGANSALPHGVPGDRVLAKGDFLTLDFGCKVDGYCSDMTRTVAIGEISAEQRRVYDTVLKAQLAAIDSVALGKKCVDIDKVARDIIYGAGYEGCFGHGLGHSVGIQIHEDPRFSPSAGEAVCEAGDVMTVEPGIYLEGRFGCRIEDMVYIGADGVQNLTGCPKELIIL